MNFVALDATTWLQPESGMIVSDPGPGTALTIVLNGNTRVIAPARADAVRARLNHNPTITPVSPDDPGMIAAGVSFWRGDRPPQYLAGNGGS